MGDDGSNEKLVWEISFGMKMQSTDGKHQLDWKIMNWHCLNSLQLKLTTHVYVFLDLVHVGSIENNCARRTPNLGSYFFKNPKSGILFLLSKQIGSRDPIFRIPLPSGRGGSQAKGRMRDIKLGPLLKLSRDVPNPQKILSWPWETQGCIIVHWAVS